MTAPGEPAASPAPAAARRPPFGQAIRDLSTFLRTHPASRGARARSLGRALAWQLAYRFGRPRALVECGRMRLWVYPGSTGASGVLYVGLPEWDEMNFVLRALRPGEHFADVGANIGSFSMLAARHVPGVRVTAVEPGEPALSRLRENLALNRLADVRVVACAAGESEGTIAFTRGRDTMNRIALESDREREVVRMTTLDALFASDPPALLKLDVEGGELRALRGGRRLLSGANAPILLLEWLNDLGREAGVAAEELVGLLEEFGYRLATYDADANRLAAWTPGQPTRHLHRIAARDLEAVAARLSEGAARGMQAPVRVRVRFPKGDPGGAEA